MRLLHLASVLSSVSLALAWTTYVVPHSAGKDDTLALAKALATNPQLSTDATILFKQGVTYNLGTPILFQNLKNVVISIQGNISYATDIKATQAIVASSKYPGGWIVIGGSSNVTLEGSQDQHGGWVNSHGQKWWDAMQSISLQVNRPRGVVLYGIQGGVVRYMKLWKPVAWAFAISGQDMHVYNNMIAAVSNSKSIAYNTDGFDVQGTNVLFENNVVYNDDDCLALCSPANNVVFRNTLCSGSHGVSIIGSMSGTTTNIQNVVIQGVTMQNSLYGARFKSSAGGSGIAKNITWKDITLKKVKYPIYVTQNYWDQHDGTAQSSNSTTTNTRVEDLTFVNIQGTLDDGWGGRDVITLDVAAGTSKAILAKSINVKTLSGKPVTVKCNPSTISYDPGFKCWNGLYEPDAAGK